MSWVVSMAVVEGLSAEQIAGRLDAEPGAETTSDSPNGEEAGAGPGLPAVGIHDDGRAVILDDRDKDAPVLEDARLLARLSHGTRVVLFELSERVNCGLFRVDVDAHLDDLALGDAEILPLEIGAPESRRLLYRPPTRAAPAVLARAHLVLPGLWQG